MPVIIMNRKTCYKYKFTVITAISACLLTVAVFIVYFTTIDNCDSDNTCLNKNCIQVAASILNHLDTTVDPCSNFYRFACGKFLSKFNDNGDDDNFISTRTKMYDELQKQLRDLLEKPIGHNEKKHLKVPKLYYLSCNNVAAIKQRGLHFVNDLLGELGDWPAMRGPNWTENFHWYQYMYKFKELGINTDFLINLHVKQETRNSSTPMIRIGPPKLGLPVKFLVRNANSEFVKIYYQYMVGVAKKMGANETTAVGELRGSLEFEISLAHIFLPNDGPIILTLSEMEKEFPGIPWFKYVNTMMSPYAVITKDEKIIVLAPKYIKNLSILLNKSSKRIQANYLLWRATSSLIPYLVDELGEIKAAFQNAVSDRIEKLPRWRKCIREVNKQLPLLINSLYLGEYFKNGSKERAREIFKNVKENLIEYRLDNEPIKIGNVTSFIGYSNDVPDDDELENMFGTLELYPEEYLQSYLSINRLKYERSMKSLRGKKITFDARLVTEIDTSYNPSHNSISFSAGALQGILFSTHNPEYVNYGGFGYVVAREMLKAFVRNKGYTLENLNESKTFRCLLQRYNNATVRENIEQVNKTVTVFDVITTQIGLEVAFAAYQNWLNEQSRQETLIALNYTPNQLFWISFAINECSTSMENYESPSSQLRVTSTVSNSNRFAKDFNCKTGSPVDPLYKCSVK